MIIAGGHKCATTSLHGMLSVHPSINMSATKEPHYLARDSLQHRLHAGVWDRRQYDALWKDARSDELLGEASALYLYFAQEVVASLRREDRPMPRIVISVRNPVDRAVSSFHDVQLKNPGERAKCFRDAMDREILGGPTSLAGADSPTLHHLALGFYCDGIRTFLDAVGRDRVHLVVFDDLISDPVAVMRNLCDFLQVSAPCDESGRVGHENRGRRQWRGSQVTSLARSSAAVAVRRSMKRHAPDLHRRITKAATARLTVPAEDMSGEVAARLDQFYAAEVRRLEDLVGRDLSHWVRPP